MTIKTKNTYRYFFTLALSLSALTTQIHAGGESPEFSDFFNPEGEWNYIGIKIFSSLDDRSLRHCAQVNPDWHQVARHIHELHHQQWHLTPEQFEERLKILLQPEEDPLTPLIMALKDTPLFDEVFSKRNKGKKKEPGSET